MCTHTQIVNCFVLFSLNISVYYISYAVLVSEHLAFMVQIQAVI